MITFAKPIHSYEEGDGFNDPIISGEEICFEALCEDMDKYPQYYSEEHHYLVESYANASTHHEIDDLWVQIVELMESLVMDMN